MLIKYKERYSILFRAIALTVVCLFLYNDLAFALAPRLAVTSKEFEGEYLASTVLLTSDKVHAYILSNVNPKLRDTYEGIRYDGVPGLLRNRGQIAQIYLEGNDDLPVIGIDSNYFYNETVRRFERKKIAGLEEIRRRKGFTCKQMAAWIRRHLRTPDPNLGGKTSRQVLDEIHEMAHSECPGIDRLYERIKAKYIKAKERGLTDERQRKRAKSLLNFAEMYAVYRDAGNKLDGDDNDINIAAQKRRTKKAVNSSDKKYAARKLMLLARSMMPRPAGRPTWIEENVPELAGKTILSISLEGNIPEFSNWPRIQNANTRGGLGAYYGDKFEGLDRIGIGENGSGIQPGYMFDKHGNHIDYEELVSAGALKEVKMAEDVEIWTWIAEDCTLSNMINGKDVINGKESWEFFRGWCRQQSHGNALLKVKFYQINRKGAKRYIAVSPVWDRLYTEDRNHRFSQEISFGKAVYEFCKKTNFVPDILHLNEGHAVVAASEMRTDQAFDRTAIVATDHTPVEAGHEKFEGPDLSRMTYILGRGGEAFKEKFIRFKDGRWIVDFSDAVIELADVRNGVAKEHAGVTAKLFEKILKEKTGKDRSINIAPVLNGSGDVWVNEELLKHQAVGSIPSEDDLHKIHEEAKVKYAFKEIEKRTGVKFDPEKPTNWVVRRITEYKSQYPMLRFLVHIMCAERDEVFTEEKLMEIWKRDILTHLESGTDKESEREKEPFYYKNLQRHMPEILKNIFAGRKQINGLGMQMVVGGPEHEGHWVNEFKRWMELPALKGKFVYVSDSDANLLRMQAIGADICTNMPRDLEEACGTSDQRTGRNGGVTISERGAGPVEWVTDYDIKKKDGSGFMFGPFTKRDNEGRMEADWDRFYTEGPGELLRRTEDASDIFYKEDDRGSPDKQEWKRLMFNSYCASTYGAFISNEGRLIKKKAVTAQAMEERYARDVYLPAILEKSDTKIINEIVVRDYCTYDSEGNIKVTGLKNAAKELEELSKRGVRHISLVGLMKHTGRPYEILNFTELDERAGTWKDWQAFLEETRKWRIKVLGDWLANQHVAKSSRLCDERPETFLYTNVSDGNYRLGFDMSCVRKGRYVPLEELRARIENGKAIVRILQRMKDDDKEIPAHGWLDVGTERNLGYKKEIEYWAADENARNSIMGLEKTHKPVIVKEEDALFLISATDLVATDKDCPRRWSALAQADLSHPDVISGAIGAGRFWLDKGLNGFRIDAALSNFPDRFQDNWGVKLGDNLTVKFMREMRAFNHNCFFLFEGYDRQGELLALADYRNCACYDWKMREYTTAALNDENKVSQLKDYLRDELRRMPKDIAEHLVNVAREHDSFDLNNPVSHLGFQDMNIMLLLYMFTPGFSMIFNGEAYGSSYEYKNDVKESESASRLKDADKDRMMVRQRILGLPRSSKAMISGVYDYLSLREGNALGLVRYDADDIIIGAANLNSGGWSTFDLKNVIDGQTKISATRPDHYIKTSYKLSADGTQWVQGKSEVKSAEELFSSGLGVNLDKKACEIVMLKRVVPGAVVMKKPESPDMAKDKRPEPEKQMTRREIRAMIERGLTYEEAVEWRRLKVEGGIKFPSHFFASAVTVKNMILVALDTIPGFKKARQESDIKTMAALYRANVINYNPKDDKKYRRHGQTAFFYEAGGLSGLMNNPSQYFSKMNSPASLIRLVLPDLIDPKNPDALDPIEVERYYWTDPENAKYHILRTLDTVPGFKDARGKNDIRTMAIIYREYVIQYIAKDAEKYNCGGQLTFFCEVGGLSGLMADQRPYLQKKNSAASLLRFAIPGLIDLTNPDALDPAEVEHDYWTDPENAIYHTLQALDTIPQFKAARERGDIKLMADLYRASVIKYKPKDAERYVYGGQTAFFYEVGRLSGLLANPRPYLAKTNSPASLLYLSLPGLIDDNNPDALKSREVEKNIRGASRSKPESPDMAKEKLGSSREPSQQSTGKYSAKDIVDKLGALQKEFVGRFNSTTNLDVIFSILPEGEEEAYFTAYKYGDAVEHEEIKVVHVNGEISGINCVRGELKGNVYGIDPGSCITLELPFLPDGKYREVRGIAHEMELESAINDVIISARILLNGGVPAGKRFIFKADTADRELIELCGAKAGLVKTLGELAAIPLLACKLPPAASANKPESPDMAKDKEVTVSAKRAGELLEIISGDFKKTLNQIAYSTAPKETISRAIDEITGRLSRVTGAGAIEIKQAFMDIVELKRDSRRYYPDLNEKVFGFNKFFAPDGLMVMGGFSQYYGDSLRIGIIDTSKERRLEMPGKKIRVFYITKWLGEPPPFFGVACFGSTDLFINEPSIGIAYDQLSQLCANLLKETGTGKLIPNALSAINELKPVFSRQEVYPQMVEEATIHEMKHLQDTLFMISKFPAASNPEQGFVQAAVKSSGLLHAYASKNKDRSEEISRAVFELSAEMANLYHAPNPKVYIARLFLHLSGKRQLHLELQLFLELFRNEILGDSKNIGSGLSRPEFDHVFAHLMNMSSDDLRQIAEKIYIREFQTPGLDTLQVPAVTKPESPDMAKDKDVISLVDYHIGNAMEALNEGRPYDAELHAKEALSLFRQYDSVRSDPFKLKEFLDLRGVESCFSLEKRATAENILKTIEAAKQARWPALMNKRADRVSLADIEAIRDATIETIICDIKKNGLGLYSPLMLLSSDTSTCGRLATYILNPRFIKSTPLKHRSPMEFEHEVDDYQMDWDSFAGSFWEIDAYPHSLALPEKDGMSKEDRLVIAEELWFDRVIMGMKKVVRERNIRTWLQNLIEDSDELAKRSIQNIVFVMRYESLRKKELPKSRQLLLMDGEFDFLPIDLSEVSYILVPSNLKQSLKKLFGDEYENKIMEVGLVADSDKPSVLVPDYGAALRQIMNKDPGVIYMTHIMRLPTSGDILYAQPYKEDEFSHSQIYTVFLKYFGISLDDKTAFRLALEYKGYFGNNKARWRLRKALSETWPVIPRLLLALIQGDDPIAIPYDLLWRGEQEIAADDGRKFKFVLKTTKGEGYKVEEEFHINVFTKNGSTEERVGYAHASVVHRDGAGKTLLMRYSDDMGFNEDTDFTGASNIRAPAIEVLKKYRDEYGGIGRAMMSLLMQIAQIKQIDNFEIQEADAGAIGFYLKLGFSKLGDNLLFPLSMQSMENAGLSFQALSIDKKIKGPEQKVITSIQSPVPTKTESPDMAKEKEEVYKKTSPAGLLEAIKENDGLMAKALDRNVGIPLEEHAGILQELGIFVPAEGRTGYFRFGDMMVGPKADDTGTFINAINGIIFKFDKIGERKPLHESELLAANIPLVKELIKMAILHEINKIQTAAIPDGKILWHILESGVVSVPQSRFPFAQGFNEEAEKLNTPERLYILKEGETIKEAMERIEKDYSNAIFDVALSDVSHVEDVYALQGKDKIKMLVFEFKEGPGDFSQLGGIMAALRALHGPKEDIIPTLRRIYSVIRGRAYDKEIDPNAIDDNDPRVLARNFIFKNLPPSEKISGDLRRVNEHLLSLLTSA